MLTALFWLVCGAALGGCSRDDRGAAIPRHRPQSFDTSALDLTDFAESTKLQHRVLYMPFGEVAARLGSVRFEGSSSFTFSRGSERYEQQDTYDVAQDAGGNFSVRLSTPHGSVEFYLVGEEAFVRLDRGHVRANDRPELGSEAWTEIAWSSMAQALEPFRPRLALTDAAQETIGGREAIRYRLALAGADVSAPQRLESVPDTPLPQRPAPAWRQSAKPLELEGTLALDRDTGVVLRLKVAGRLEIPDPKGRPTELVLRYQGGLADVGKVTEIRAPKSRPEYRVQPRVRDALSFFRRHLDPPPAAAP